MRQGYAERRRAFKSNRRSEHPRDRQRSCLHRLLPCASSAHARMRHQCNTRRSRSAHPQCHRNLIDWRWHRLKAMRSFGRHCAKRIGPAVVVAIVMRPPASADLTLLDLCKGAGLSSSQPISTCAQMNFSPALRDQSPANSPRFGQHLKAVQIPAHSRLRPQGPPPRCNIRELPQSPAIRR